ncbi:pyrroline-5-carboxylate reductase dimerization domain-containing protein [Streptomyces sp. NPDC007851]|uniref:pyrroline-5-carboxylate reductase family protein n=1 Tax=Streptomyces sp. NPDC007851 TaxID=3155008 RepID=UPI0033F7F77B
MSVAAAAGVAFVGCGRIARATVQGLVSAGHPAERLQGVSRTGAGARALSREFGTLFAASPSEAVRGVRLVVVATHPHETAAVLKDLAECVTQDHVLVSLVASWRTEAVSAALPGVPVVRAVPNVGVALRAGTTVISPGPGATDVGLAETETLFGRLGRVVVADENALEAVSAVSGAGPALIAYFTEALAAAGTEQGLDRSTAALLATQAVRSAGALLDHADSPRSVIESVMSPGGMTAEALRVLQERGVAEATRAATAAAVRLSYERMVTGG